MNVAKPADVQLSRRGRDRLPPMLESLWLTSREGNAASRLGKPLLSLSWALATPGLRRPNESHTTSVGSQDETDNPGA